MIVGRAVNRVKRVARVVAVYGAITLGTLALLDLALITTGLFPPTHDYGHPDVGWVSAEPSGEMTQDRCAEPGTGRLIPFQRNERGLRTSFPDHELVERNDILKIAVGGDSHTELCAANELTHFGFTQQFLDAAGVPSAAFAFGGGKYSPLQGYLAVRPAMLDTHADVFVLNFYTGNDFYDMLRVDDRPHFEESAEGFHVAPPVWYQHDPPGSVHRSRVLYALRSLAGRVGVSRAWVRIRYLNDVARAQGKGLGDVVGYMADLRRSTAPELSYPQALVAQMLNQQLFFHRFPEAEQESLRRVDALLRMIREENPDRILVLSPIPSYELVYEDEVDAVLEATLDRLPVTRQSGVEEEGGLHAALLDLGREYGWVVVDNLPELRAARGVTELYDPNDYHIKPPASEIIGRAQAARIAAAVEGSHHE